MGVSSGQVWQETFVFLRQQRSALVKLSFFGVVLPYLLGVLFLSHRSQGTIAATRAAEGYPDILLPFSGFILEYVGVSGVFAAVVLFAAVAVVFLALGEKDHFQQSLKLCFPRGFVLLLVLGLFSCERLFFGAFPVFSMFVAMAFVLVAVEGTGIWQALRISLTFRYGGVNRGFQTSFLVLSLSAVYFLFNTLMDAAFHFIMQADIILSLPRTLWVTEVPYFNFSFMFLFGKVVYALGLGFQFVVIPAYLFFLYRLLRQV